LSTTIAGHEETIGSLNKKLAETTDNLVSVTEEKDSMAFLGALVSKSTYNIILWTIIAGLLLLLLFFIYNLEIVISLPRRPNRLFPKWKRSTRTIEDGPWNASKRSAGSSRTKSISTRNPNNTKSSRNGSFFLIGPSGSWPYTYSNSHISYLNTHISYPNYANRYYYRGSGPP